MLLEVRGTCAINKGDELMLRAISQHYAHQPDVSLCAEHITGPYQLRAPLGFYQKVRRTEVPVIDLAARAFLLPWSGEKYGLVSSRDVHAVLDSSGFAYGDQWGHYRARKTANLVRYWKRSGRKLIMLPQALGPFTNSELRRLFTEVASYASLVFARDSVSYQHLLSFDLDPERVLQAPDFTNLLEGVVPEGFDVDPTRVAVIPNKRMLDKTDPKVAAAYEPFLLECLRYIHQVGLRPSIVLHELRDIGLATGLADSLPFEVELIQHGNALALKGILGTCRAVVSSRFHGAVSALSQGVPCILTGWSHKYAMLAEEYGCPDLLIDDPSHLDEVRSKIEDICCNAARDGIVDVLTQTSETLRQATCRMWDLVDAELRVAAPDLGSVRTSAAGFHTAA